MWSVLTSMLSFGPSDTAEVAPSDFNIEGQVVLILCGLIGSGKSTFAESLQSHFPQFRRCNQDDLGDRRRVEHLARDSLSQGLSVCIDRTNFNESQRSYWIDIAHEFPGTAIWVIVFDTPYEVGSQLITSLRTNGASQSPIVTLIISSQRSVQPGSANVRESNNITVRCLSNFQHQENHTPPSRVPNRDCPC